MRHLALALTASVGTLAVGAPRSIVDQSLARTEVDLIGWDGALVAYRDHLGRVQREPVENVLAVLPTAWDGPAPWEAPPDDDLAGGRAVVVELVDGQRLIGSMGPWTSSTIGPGAGDPGEAKALGVWSAGRGVRRVPLDRIARVLVDPWAHGVSATPGAWASGVDDEIVFRNGDRVRGFVVSLSEGVRFDDGAGEREFGVDQVREIRLGNPSQPPGGPRVWWRRGEVLGDQSVGFDDGGALSLADGLGAEPTEGRVVDVLAAHPTERVTVPLASLDLVEASPAAGRRWTSPPLSGPVASSPLGTPDIVLPGPMRAGWRLPAGVDRFGTVIRLGATLERRQAEPSRWSHVRVRVLVEHGGAVTEVASATLDRRRSTLGVAVELPGVGQTGRTLVIEVDPADYGPIDDVVLLDRPMLASASDSGSN